MVVLSHGSGSAASASNPDVIGTTISLSGDSYAVIGVLGAVVRRARVRAGADVWVPFQIDPNQPIRATTSAPAAA